MNKLGVSIIIVIFIIALTALSFVRSYGNSVDVTGRTFTVQGEGKIVAVSDIAQFNFGVSTEGGKGISGLKEDNAKKINSIIDFLKSKDVDAKDIKTTMFNISPRYNNTYCTYNAPCPALEIIGYSINQSVTIKVRDLDKVGELLDGVVANGANNVSGLTFMVDDQDEFEKEAREEAIEEARDKAKDIAKAGKFRLGKLVSINENGYSPVMPYRSFDMAKAGIGGGGEVKIEAGSQEIVINVTMQYEIR